MLEQQGGSYLGLTPFVSPLPAGFLTLLSPPEHQYRLCEIQQHPTITPYKSSSVETLRTDSKLSAHTLGHIRWIYLLQTLSAVAPHRQKLLVRQSTVEIPIL